MQRRTPENLEIGEVVRASLLIVGVILLIGITESLANCIAMGLTR